LELFCWALAGILFLARAEDGIVVSGAIVHDKPEAHKWGFQKSPEFFEGKFTVSLQSDAREE
jgi:hypothetical protein